MYASTLQISQISDKFCERIDTLEHSHARYDNIGNIDVHWELPPIPPLLHFQQGLLVTHRCCGQTESLIGMPYSCWLIGFRKLRLM